MKSSHFSLVERDYEILHHVCMMGGLTATDITTLLFSYASANGVPIPHSRCQLRLKLLYEHGYLDRIEPLTAKGAGTKPNVHILTKKGARLLASYLGKDLEELSWRKIDKGSGELFLAHLMMTNEVRVACMHAVKHLPFQAAITTWSDGTGTSISLLLRCVAGRCLEQSGLY